MRIAVIQLAVDPGRRAATLQHALAALDRAAEVDPAPDLILLPSFSDLPDVILERPVLGERLQGQTTAAVSDHARQWGVYVAFGFVERTAKGLVAAGVLLDRDGDVAQVRRSLVAEQPETLAEAAPAVSETIIGGIRVLTMGDLTGSQPIADTPTKPDMLICPGCFAAKSRESSASEKKLKKKAAAVAEEFKTHLALADVIVESKTAPWSFPGAALIADPAGAILSEAGGKADTLWVDVPVIHLKNPSMRAGT